MRLFKIKACAYIFLLCTPLHLMAYSGAGAIAGVTSSSEPVEVSISDWTEAPGPGKKKKKQRHKAKRKRMGKHKNLSDRANGGIFGKGKKKDGTGQNVLFLIVPAVAVAGIAVLFVSNTNQKNSEPVPDPTGTN